MTTETNFILSNLQRKNVLSKKDERVLLKLIEENNKEAKELLISKNLGMIKILASKLSNSTDVQKDLIQQGVLEIDTAIEHFDLSRNVKFATFYHQYAEIGMKKYLLTQKKYAKMTKKEKKNIDEWFKAKSYFISIGNNNPSEIEMTDYLKQSGLTLKDIRQIEYIYFSSFTNEVPVEDVEISHSLDSTDSFFKDELSNQINNEMLDAAINRLTDREKDVINKKFGLNGEKTHTLQEIANIYGFSKERIRQIKASALFKIERYIINKL